MSALVATVMGIISPYLVKGAEEFAASVGKAAFDGVASIVERLGKWWKNDPVAEAAANSIKLDPGHFSPLLAAQLEYGLNKDEAFARELRALVDRMGPAVDVVQRMEVARGVTGADIVRLVGGSVKVQQDIREAHDVIGFKGGTVGGS